MLLLKDTLRLCIWMQCAGQFMWTHQRKIMRRPIQNFNTPPPGIPRAFDCASCPGRGEFERCAGRVGNLKQIYLLSWHNTLVSFFRFLQGLTDLQDRISPLLMNNSFKRVFKRSLKVSLQHLSLWKVWTVLIEEEICLCGEVVQY